MNGLASVCGSNSVLPVPSKSPSYLLLVYNSVVRSFTHSKGGKVNTPLLFLGPLWREGKELSTKSTTIALQTVCKKLDLELHGTQEDQRGPIESELNEYGHNGRVLAPVIGRYGGASSDLSLILDLVAREMARKHTAFYNIGFSEAKA